MPEFSNYAGPKPSRIPDFVIEIDNKSLTHRPDLWGHFGMAREIAAITGKRLVDPVKLSLIPGEPSPVRVEIEDLELCPRYSALVFDNVTVGPSPLWLQYRLTSIGLNPINNIVDLTNYLMAELAQPMHAFDRAKLRGDTIYARPAREGERIKALNDTEYAPGAVQSGDSGRRRSHRHCRRHRRRGKCHLRRYYVHCAGECQLPGVQRAQDVLGAEIANRRFHAFREGPGSDQHHSCTGAGGRIAARSFHRESAWWVGSPMRAAAREIPPVTLDLDWLGRKLGRSSKPRKYGRSSKRCEFKVNETGPRVFSVRIPSWRATKDIAMAEDLVEEVGRMIGYDSIPPKPPLIAATVPPEDPRRMFVRRVKSAVALQGFTEVSNYSFLSEEQVQRFGMRPEDHVRVLNPIAADQSLMRTLADPGHFLEPRREQQTLRVVPALRNRKRDSQACGRIARAGVASRRGGVQSGRRRSRRTFRTQATGRDPGTRRGGARDRNTAL